MLKTIGTIPTNVDEIISEIFKSNVRLLAKATEKERKKEILLCKQEGDAILNTYEILLVESTRLVVSNIYSIVESMISEIIPNFQMNQEFVSELIQHEIDPIGELELNFKDVEIVTGSTKFYDAFFELFTLELNEELNEDVLIFNYKDEIKTIDFSTLHTNLLREVSSCREKHLSMIDAIRMRV